MTSLEPPFIAGVLLSRWVLGVVIFVIWGALFTTIKGVAFALIRRRIAARPEVGWVNTFLGALSPALLIVIWASGLALMARALPLPPR